MYRAGRPAVDRFRPRARQSKRRGGVGRGQRHASRVANASLIELRQTFREVKLAASGLGELGGVAEPRHVTHDVKPIELLAQPRESVREPIRPRTPVLHTSHSAEHNVPIAERASSVRDADKASMQQLAGAVGAY